MPLAKTVIKSVLTQVRSYYFQSWNFSCLLSYSKAASVISEIFSTVCFIADVKWFFSLSFGFCNRDDVANLIGSKYSSPAWGSAIDFHMNSMTRIGKPALNQCHIWAYYCTQSQGFKSQWVWLRAPSIFSSAVRPGTELGYTASHRIKPLHTGHDVTWHNMFGGLKECYLCIHRHYAPSY